MTAALSDPQIYSAALKAGFSAPDAVIMTAVCLAESGGVPDIASKPNTNGTVDYGLAQINSSHTALLAGGNWRDPVSNLSMARSLFVGSGNKFTPWTTYKNGTYARFIARAQAASGGTPVAVPVDNSTGNNSDKAASDFQSKVDAATSAQVWQRIAYFVAGAILLLMVIASLLKNTSLGKVAIKAAKTAALA